MTRRHPSHERDSVTEQVIPEFTLDDCLLDHLAIPESAMRLWQERISSDLLLKHNVGVKDALNFVIAYIDEHREAPSAGVLSRETGFSEFNEPEAPIKYVIDELRDRFRRKEIQRITQKVARGSADTAQALRDGFEEFSLLTVKTTDRQGVIDANDSLSVIDRYNQAMEEQGITFGYKDMDEAFGGLRKERLYFVCGRPKRYKSWQLIKSFVGALRNHDPAVFFTLEMSEKEVHDRVSCMWSSISWDRFNKKQLLPQEIKQLQMGVEQMREECQFQIIKPKLEDRTVPYMTNHASYLPCDVVYVDQISKVVHTGQHRERHEQIASICHQLKDMADLWPVFVAAQLNRDASNLKEMADLSKIGLSDAIGQTGDMLLGLFTNKDMMQSKIIHYGTIDSRSFEGASWEVKVNLTEHGDFRTLGRLDD